MTTLDIDIRLARSDFRLALAHAFLLSGVTAVFGPSGCGKTSLLRVIAGLERGAEGRVALGDEVWQAPGRFTPPHKRRVGYVFQDARLFAHLSVAENLDYAARRAAPGAPGPGRAAVIDALDLGPLLGRRAPELSGGEAQRVAIGRTLLSRPRLLLMDEPLASLDAARKADLLPYIARVSGAFAAPVLYVTHSVDEVARLADRVVALSDGRLTAAGPVVETMARLAPEGEEDGFEASVLLDARVTAVDDAYRLATLDLGGQPLAVPDSGLRPGEAARIRIRARDVALAVTRPEATSIRNILAGRLAALDAPPGGAFAEATVEIAPGLALRARITRASADELALAPGAPVFALVRSVSFDRRRPPG